MLIWIVYHNETITGKGEWILDLKNMFVVNVARHVRIEEHPLRD